MGWLQRLFRRMVAPIAPLQPRTAADIVGGEHVLAVDGESVDDPATTSR